jgi:hypothetical protein
LCFELKIVALERAKDDVMMNLMSGAEVYYVSLCAGGRHEPGMHYGKLSPVDCSSAYDNSRRGVTP